MSINKTQNLIIESQEELFEALSDECCEQLTGGKKWWKKVTKKLEKWTLKVLNNSDNSATQTAGTTGLAGYTGGEIALEESGMMGGGQLDGH